jgi:hypothetical protein
VEADSSFPELCLLLFATLAWRQDEWTFQFNGLLDESTCVLSRRLRLWYPCRTRPDRNLLLGYASGLRLLFPARRNSE